MNGAVNFSFFYSESDEKTQNRGAQEIQPLFEKQTIVSFAFKSIRGGSAVKECRISEWPKQILRSNLIRYDYYLFTVYPSRLQRYCI